MNTFIADDGREIEFQAISLVDFENAQAGIKKDFLKRKERITPPTYKVVLAGGGVAEHELTEDILEVVGDEEETNRRIAEWAEYKAATNKMNETIGLITTEIVLDGIVVKQEDVQEWAKRQRRRYIELPDDPEKLTLEYKMNEVLKTPANLLRAQQEIIILSGSGAIRREDVEAASRSFHDSVQKISERSAGEMDTPI